MKRVISAVLSLLLLSGGLLLFCACGTTEVRYENEANYRATPLPVNLSFMALDVHWISGSVTVTPGTKFSVSETAGRELTDDEGLRWWLDNRTLRLQFCKAGTYDDLPAKDLTVTVPSGTVLSGLSVTTGSADVSAGAEISGDCEITTGSGNVSLSLSSPKTLTVTTGSGGVRATCGTLGGYAIVTGSGDTELTVSKGSPATGTWESGSGDLRFRIVSGGFRASFHTVSGTLSGLGRDYDGNYLAGNGRDGRYEWTSASGSVYVQAPEYYIPQ